MNLMVGFFVYKTFFHIKKNILFGIFEAMKIRDLTGLYLLQERRSAHLCLSLTIGACTLFSGLLNLQPCCLPHISSFACHSQEQPRRPDLCWAAGAVEVTQRFFLKKKKAENKNFPLGAARLQGRAHKALELLANAIHFTCSPAHGA